MLKQGFDSIGPVSVLLRPHDRFGHLATRFNTARAAERTAHGIVLKFNRPEPNVAAGDGSHDHASGKGHGSSASGQSATGGRHSCGMPSRLARGAERMAEAASGSRPYDQLART